MTPPKSLLVTAVALVLQGNTTSAHAQDTSAPELEAVKVSADSADELSQSATGLPLSTKETPQSVSVITADTIETLGLDDVNEVLDIATGVNVERVETDRTYYNARGFDIKNFQIDGTGVPLHWANVVGALDSALYEKVEVVRGANGLLVGTGNPSASLNFIRKRPGNNFEGSVKATVGGWNKRRVEADVSTPLTESGDWAARVIAVQRSADSYLDNYSNQRAVMSALVEGILSDKTKLTLGYTDHQSRGDGALWGALPLLDSNGNTTNFDVSTSTAMDWTFYQAHNRTAFVELVQDLGSGWEWKTLLTQNSYLEHSELFYVYGTYDSVTGTGLYGYPGKYLAEADRKMLDSSATGRYTLAGRIHELTLGISASSVASGYLSYDAPTTDPAWAALPAFPGWQGTEIPRAAFGPGYESADIDSDARRLYAATRINATDQLKVILGANAIRAESKGISFDAPQNRDDQKLSPYTGVVYSVNDQLNAYASYSTIFDPQVETGVDHKNIGPAKGSSQEVGIKAETLNRRVQGNIAVFSSSQDNLAQEAGMDENFITFYEGTDVTAEGFELEVMGQPVNGFKLFAGYTRLKIEDTDGEDARNHIPRQTLKLASSYQLARNMEVGGTARWQDDVHTDSDPRIKQDAYSVLAAYVSYKPVKQLELALNLDNLTNKKYLTSLYWDQAYYAEPRSVSASMKFDF